MRNDYIEVNTGNFFREQPTSISENILVSASGTTNAVWVPDGAYVTKVGVLAVAGVSASTTINVGDGNRADRFLDGISTMATSDIIIAPTIETASNSDIDVGTLRTHEVAGHYYSSADSIDVVVTNSKSGGGTIKVLAWWYVP